MGLRGLQKQTVEINFSQGIATKNDPYQIPIGQFQSLNNSVFEKQGLLKKRYGNRALPSLPDTTSSYVTTFNNNLTAIGSNLKALSAGSETWVTKGTVKPVEISTLSLVRSSTNQTQCDSAVSSNGFVCTVFTDMVPVAGTPTAKYMYQVQDAVTGQNIIGPSLIAPLTGTVTGSPRVFYLGRYFIIVFTNLITGTDHLQYFSINTSNLSDISTNVDISANYTPDTTVNFDGFVANNSLYLAWNGSDVGGAIRVTYLDSTLTLHSPEIFTGYEATLMSVAADESQSTPVIWVSFYDLNTTKGYTTALNQNLDVIVPITEIIPSGTVLNIASTANDGSVNVYYEVDNDYSYGATLPSHYINAINIDQSSSVGSIRTLVRSVGLASKAFLYDGSPYFVGIYYSENQPTYFLFDSNGSVLAKLAYSNGGPYLTLGLPSVSVLDGVAQISYLVKDLVEPVNKSQGAEFSSGVYAQTGVSLANFDLANGQFQSAEIAQNLHLSGGILWQYDGQNPVEQGFHLWPDNIVATWSATGGSIHAQPDGSTNTDAYYYQVTYEWSDNQGNIYRSAPSIPVAVTTTSNGTSGSITVNIPYLRLTYKTVNKVKLVVYRWSVAQQNYYQVTSITNPQLNSTTSDSLTFVDTLADASIIGNNLIYTTGGVVENIASPACTDVSLYRSRAFTISAEDPNVLNYSKQVIQGTPVEFSDLFTLYVAPTIGAQGSTGGMKCIFPMDDKLIIFKEDAIYYIVGNGPDNTGANNDFSEPVFITSTVGCDNKRSIVSMPQGLMFQSDKGIWLLGRDLSTQYIGASVEDFNAFTVLSAQTIPSTNQVRFNLSNGTTLMYDYYFGQWETFTGASAISSTLYQRLQTYINSYGKVYQETPGTYLDGTNPVLMSFKTGWFNLAGLQGFERAYFMYFLATYISPHILTVGISYDYNPSIVQQATIYPVNYNGAYGSDSLYGAPQNYGGNGSIEQWRIFFDRQKCQAIQITVTEHFDPSFGTQAGAGLTMSGINLVVGLKDGHPRINSALSAS
jgi:hypothetical protein